MVHSDALRPAWTPLTVVLMVIGFMLFWPLGLIMLAYILWGDHVPEVRRHFAGMRRSWSRDWGGCGPRGYARSGNSAFDDYRERELRRLDEERRKLDEAQREFAEYSDAIRRAKDREEFDRFMAERRARPAGGGSNGN